MFEVLAIPSLRGTFCMRASVWSRGLEVLGGGTGVVSHAGLVLLGTWLSVACTRARDHLYISYTRAPSPFIDMGSCPKNARRVSGVTPDPDPRSPNSCTSRSRSTRPSRTITAFTCKSPFVS